MKIGLLECDHVREEFRHIAGDYRDMFPALFREVAPYWTFTFFDVCNDAFPASVHDCDAYICTGSKYSVYDDEPWIHRLQEFVRQLYNSQKPYVGVCFGHQLLAEALGGKVQKAETGWCVGVHGFELVQPEAWMQPALPAFNSLMMCQDQVLALPPEGTLLARTPSCAVGMFRVGTFMLGIQAHPEFTKEYDEALIRARVDRIGTLGVEAGLQSLALATDQLVFAEWIVRFVEAAQGSLGGTSPAAPRDLGFSPNHIPG
ncbi:GMP synthase [Rhabdobacter roseus]|uniref:GMP synthase-like glutamine amidotransferase n=1 Tax=Rhabdobacter roseus TaxID=1655419 RepID=A0A840TJ99_9BACT|nr:amidotransferase [Rhabdobacter roseus]MBB5284276.1 GMP synthase-like glutamine amidotransferase [Rhabdobacter roseus]